MPSKLKTFLEMIKIEHSIFALPFAYLGLFLATNASPSWPLLGWITLAMVSFRTMGMGLNRLFDHAIDAANPRTQFRALPAKMLTRREVWLGTLLAKFLFMVSVFNLDPRCWLLAPIPMALAWIYPFMKRISWLSHFVLGLILGISPYAAWLAAGREFSWVPGLITIGVVAWVAGFDVIYALQDEAFDRQYRLHSLPSRFGAEKSLLWTAILHMITISSWLAAGWLADLGWVYFLGMGMVILFLLREHWLVRSFGVVKLNEAFFTMNAVVSISIFVAAVADTVLARHL